MKWWRSWPENIVSMQIFPSASFIWLFISIYWKNWIMNNASNLNSSGCSLFSSSLLMKSRKRLACEVFDAIATHTSLVNKGGITELFATKLGMVIHMHQSWARVSSENIGLLRVFKVKVTGHIARLWLFLPYFPDSWWMRPVANRVGIYWHVLCDISITGHTMGNSLPYSDQPCHYLHLHKAA